MPNVNKDITSYAVDISKMSRDKHHNSQGNNELTSLSDGLEFVCNTNNEFDNRNILNNISDYINQVCQRLWMTHSRQFRDESGNNKNSERELRKILAEGEKLSHLADSLRSSNAEESVPCIWKGGFLTRCLVGVGILSGAGILGGGGYWYYARRHDPTSGSTSNSGEDPLHPTAMFRNERVGMFEDAAANHSLYHDNPINRTHHTRRHLEPHTHSITQSTSSDDDVKIEPVKICYKYVGNGRAGIRWPIPCPNDLTTKNPINNIPPYIYTYTPEQPTQCKTQYLEEQCQKTHDNYYKKHPDRVLIQLILKVGNTPCYCPPPKGANIKLISPPHLQKKVQQVPVNIPIDTLPVHTTVTPIGSNTKKTLLILSTEKPVVSPQPAEFIPRRGNLYIISPDLDKEKTSQDKTYYEDSLEEYEDVKIESLYDFSCIEQREDMSLADIIRQVGKTLSYPVQSLAIESQVIHHHNTLKKGCSSANEMQRLQEITQHIDAVLSQVLSMVKGANPIVILQSIVGPALEMCADDIDGKPRDLQKVSDIEQQILFLSRRTIPTLTAEDIRKIFDKNPNVNDAGKQNQPKIFKLKEGDLYVSLDNKEYKLINDETKNSFLIEKDHGVRRVYFDKKEGHWEEFKQHDTLNYAQAKLLEDYGVKLKDVLKLNRADINLDEKNPEIMIVKNQGVTSKHVVINGLLVPVEEIQFNNGAKIMVAISSKFDSKKVLIQGEYGWRFERDSTKIGSNLELILESIKNTGLDYTENKKFTCIRTDELSYDDTNNPYVKYEGKYYEVTQITPSLYSLNKAPGNYFSMIDGFLKISFSGVILDFDERIKVGLPKPEVNSNVYLEKWSYYYIMAQAKRVLDAEPDINIGPGLYVDKKNRMTFIINGVVFLVKKSSGNKIELESKMEGSENIKLFRIKDLIVKVREQEIIPIKYKEIIGCRAIRSPAFGGSGCSAVWIEDDLDSIFKEKISSQSHAKKSVIENSIVNSKDEHYPNLFHSVESGKLYFLYDGHYFNAERVPVNEAKNPTGKVVLNIYTSGDFFRKRRLIASLISEKKENRIEIKTVGGFISEGANVNKNIAISYIESRKYKDINNIKTIEGAVEQLNLSGDAVFPEIKSGFTPDVDESILKKHILNEFYPPRVIMDERYRVKVINLSAFDETAAVSLRQTILKMRELVIFIKNHMLPTVMLEIKAGNRYYYDYVAQVFKTEDFVFISGFLNEVFKRIAILNKNILMENIFVCGLYRKKVDGVNALGELIQSEIKEKLLSEERKRGTFAFATTDKSKRIFISIDKLYFADPTNSDPNLRSEPETDLITTLLHEASHINGMTTDYVYLPREDGKISPILDCLDSLADKVEQENLKDAKNFKKMTTNYINNIPLLKDSFSNPLDMKEVAYLMAHDKGFLAHILLNTADGIALLIRDLHNMIDLDSEIEY